MKQQRMGFHISASSKGDSLVPMQSSSGSFQTMTGARNCEKRFQTFRTCTKSRRIWISVSDPSTTQRTHTWGSMIARHPKGICGETPLKTFHIKHFKWQWPSHFQTRFHKASHKIEKPIRPIWSFEPKTL